MQYQQNIILLLLYLNHFINNIHNVLLISSIFIFVTAQMIGSVYFCRRKYFQECRKAFGQMTLCCSSAGAERTCASFPSKSHTVMRSISSWKEQPILLSQNPWINTASEDELNKFQKTEGPQHRFLRCLWEFSYRKFLTSYRSPCIHRFLWKQEPDCRCSFENLIRPPLQIWSPNMSLRVTRNKLPIH